MRSDIFKIRAYSRTLGVDFYKEITTDTDFVSVMGGILHSPEILAKLEKRITEAEKNFQNEISRMVREKEEDKQRELFLAFVETVKALSMEQLNKKLIDAILNYTYNTNPVFRELSLEELLSKQGISLEDMNKLVKDTSTDFLDVKTKILYDLENQYLYYNDSNSGYRWLKDTVKTFLDFVNKINKLGYTVCFVSDRMFGKGEEVYAYDLLDKIVKSPSWPSSKYLLHKCISPLRDVDNDKVTSNLIINLD
jgi:hypothetical protein|nr:MAG TPA: hypothetical protein [Caudoviricetes sp.]